MSAMGYIALLRRIRELQEDIVMDLTSLARKSKSPTIKALATSLLADELVVMEVLRALLRASSRLDDIRYMTQLEKAAEMDIEQELERALVRLDMIFVKHKEKLRLVEELHGQLDNRAMVDVVETIMRIDERLIRDYEDATQGLREKIRKS